MAESRTVAALSVVMNVLQLDERRALREENARLREQLAMWKGKYAWKPEPEVGKYYVFEEYGPWKPSSYHYENYPTSQHPTGP